MAPVPPIAAPSRSLRSLAMIVALCLTAILLAMALIDRPWSTWAHHSLGGVAWLVWLTHIPDALAPLAAIGLAAAGSAACAGWRPGPHGRTLLACAVAVAIALLVKDQLKFAFGRTWPETWTGGNPSWIRDGVFTFSPFHGGKGWTSFPSGHTALITAPAAVLWRSAARWRWLWAAMVTAVAVGLLGSDYHWMSDILAGGCIGAAAGMGALAMVGDRRG